MSSPVMRVFKRDERERWASIGSWLTASAGATIGARIAALVPVAELETGVEVQSTPDGLVIHYDPAIDDRTLVFCLHRIARCLELTSADATMSGSEPFSWALADDVPPTVHDFTVLPGTASRARR